MAGGQRIGVVGATGAVGTITLRLLRERGYGDVRAFASARSAGSTLDGLTVEEATPEALEAGDLDLCLFSVGTSASRALVPRPSFAESFWIGIHGANARRSRAAVMSRRSAALSSRSVLLSPRMIPRPRSSARPASPRIH